MMSMLHKLGPALNQVKDELRHICPISPQVKDELRQIGPILPQLMAQIRKSALQQQRFEVALLDRGNFSQISSTIELKPRIKRFWPQGRAKRRKKRLAY
jgi:hypothetical protein